MKQRTWFKRINLWVPLPSAELRRLISIDTGEQAKRARIARRGHRRGMPYPQRKMYFNDWTNPWGKVRRKIVVASGNSGAICS